MSNMHTIKFRGKSLSTGEWVYGYYYATPLHFLDKPDVITHCIIDTAGSIYKVDPTTLGQYTGLEDKNGKEIYEGDFLTLSSYRGREEVKVEWHNAGYYIFIHKDGTKTGQYFRLPDSKMIELVSHDNPTLLTQ